MRFLLVLLALIAVPAAAESFSGKVVSIQDGDTLTVLAERETRVRLAEIDAPELRQAFGEQARASLAELCLGKSAQVRVVAREPQGLVRAHVKCDALDANAEQVRRGLAWVYKRHATSTSPLYFLEDQAQRARDGLWADPSPAPPWRWRANKANRR
jgi:endonuclease YncB( thermonuclease family)